MYYEPFRRPVESRSTTSECPAHRVQDGAQIRNVGVVLFLWREQAGMQAEALRTQDNRPDDGYEHFEKLGQEGPQARRRSHGDEVACRRVSAHELVTRHGDRAADAATLDGPSVGVEGRAGAARVELADDGYPVTLGHVALPSTKGRTKLETRIEQEVMTCAIIKG